MLLCFKPVGGSFLWLMLLCLKHVDGSCWFLTLLLFQASWREFLVAYGAFVPIPVGSQLRQYAGVRPVWLRCTVLAL